MERLLGGDGPDAGGRLGLEPPTADRARCAGPRARLARWQRRAENPLSSREVADAARVLVRTCEGMLVSLG